MRVQSNIDGGSIVAGVVFAVLLSWMGIWGETRIATGESIALMMQAAFMGGAICGWTREAKAINVVILSYSIPLTVGIIVMRMAQMFLRPLHDTYVLTFGIVCIGLSAVIGTKAGELVERFFNRKTV